jgi:hypothetical protein
MSAAIALIKHRWTIEFDLNFCKTSRMYDHIVNQWLLYAG